MAEEKAASTIPKKGPGILCGVEWSKKGTVTLSQEEKNAIEALVRKLNQKNSPAWREQVIRVWEKRLFNRGYQHILPKSGGGWKLPDQGTGYGQGEEGSTTPFELNIYNGYGEIVVGALTREVPKVRFKSAKPDNDAGITAAQSAEAVKENVIHSNKILTLLEDVGSYLWTDGLTVFHTFYELNAQRFGYGPNPPEVVPENETAHDQADASQVEHEGDDADSEATGAQPTGDGDENQSVSEGEGARTFSHEAGYTAGAEEEGTADESGDDEGDYPLGREVIEIGGALEWKIPIKANCLAEAGYAIGSREIDISLAKAKFPECADKITAGKGGVGGDDVDRLARVNVREGMYNSYNTTDSSADEVTWQRVFVRPWQLLAIMEETPRDSIIEKFPNGLYVQFCGSVLCQAEDKSMDNHLVLLHAKPGDGYNRPGIGDWLMPVQKVLNNWVELANDYFTRGVPAKWMDNEMFDVEALQDQVNEVGATHPFDREPGVTLEEVIFEETPPVFPEQLTAFIENFKGDLPQLLCGAFPALFGGGDAGPTDTLGGMQIQRDQALGRLGMPWRRLKEAMACVLLQAVECLAQNHVEPISVIGKMSITIEMDDLKGSMLALPDVDENFPETQTQKSNRVVTLISEAGSNPMLGDLIDSPDNLEFVRDAIGIPGFVIPKLESRDKQLGEIEVMLNTGPIPNPQIAALKKQLAEIAKQAENPQLAANPDAHAKMVQAAQELEAQIAQLPPEVSSEEIDEIVDDSEVEAMVCWRFLVSPRGRQMKKGTKDERAAYDNIRLHYIGHKDIGEKKAADAAAKAKMAKPPSISGNIKDMTPDEQAQALAQANIKTDPQSIAQQRAAKLAAEHPHEAVPVGA